MEKLSSNLSCLGWEEGTEKGVMDAISLASVVCLWGGGGCEEAWNVAW